MTPAEKLSRKKPWRRAPRNRVDINGYDFKDCSLRAIREGLRLSMKDVAAAVCLSPSSYWHIEHGRDLCLTTARRIAVFFGKSVDEIWPRQP